MRKFTALTIGQLISSIGSGLTDFGLAIFVLKLTGSVTATAIISICAFLPSILLAPFGGVMADHYDRRLMMVAGEALSGLGLLVCLFSVWSLEPSFIVICIGVALSSVFTALTEPAFRATITDLLTEEEFAKAGGMVQIAGNAKLLISPALAGILLQKTNVGTLILIDILTFFTTVGVILIVKKGILSEKNGKKKLHFMSEMQEGMKTIKGNKGIVSMIVIMTATVFCLGFIQILSKPLILAFAGEKELGILTTVSACGMIAGSVLISIKKEFKSYVRLLAFGMVGCGLCFGFMAVKESIPVMIVFGFLMFTCMPAVQIGAEVLIRKNLDNEVQGRAFGLISLITQMGYIFAYLLSGLLSDYVFEPFMCGNSKAAELIGGFIGNGSGRGVALLIIIAGIGMAAIGILAARFKSVRELERKAV